MARSDNGRVQRRPATSAADRELQLADAAFDLAEEQIRNGTASSQVITTAMRYGSTRERMEQMRMAHEIELMEVKKEQLQSQARVEELFADAIRAFRGYSGLPEGADAEGFAYEE